MKTFWMFDCFWLSAALRFTMTGQTPTGSLWTFTTCMKLPDMLTWIIKECSGKSPVSEDLVRSTANISHRLVEGSLDKTMWISLQLPADQTSQPKSQRQNWYHHTHTHTPPTHKQYLAGEGRWLHFSTMKWLIVPHLAAKTTSGKKEASLCQQNTQKIKWKSEEWFPSGLWARVTQHGGKSNRHQSGV